MLFKTKYSADLAVTDAEGNLCGDMDVLMNLGAAYSLPNMISGNNSPHLDTKSSYGTAVWQTYAADMNSLVK